MPIEERIDRSTLHATTHEEADVEDVEYWLSKTPTERIEALEYLEGGSMATIRLTKEFSEFLSLLNLEKIEYLLIGGRVLPVRSPQQ